MVLLRLLTKNLKNYYILVAFAILVTIGQVGCDLIAAMPLKFIPSKVNNPGSDPACSFPFLDPILSFFDTPILDPSLRPTGPNQPIGQPPPAPCPANPSDPQSIIHPMITQHSVIGVIVFSLLLLIVFGGLSAVLAFFEIRLATTISQQVSANLRQQLFDHLQRLSLDWHDRQKKGDLVQRVTGNIADVEKLVNDGLVDLLAGVLTLVGVAICMLLISAQYTFLSLLITPLLFLLTFTYTGGIKNAARHKSKASGKIADVATEDMNALLVIRAFTLEQHENTRFGDYVGKERNAGMQAGRLQAQFTPLVALLIVFGTLVVVGVGGYVAAGNPMSLGLFTLQGSTIDVGTLILFLTYLKMLYQPMRDLSKLTLVASNASSGAERIQEILDQAPEVSDIQQDYTGPQRLRGDICFKNVSFGYVPDQIILNDISLTIPAGRKIALVGHSGSGKTTLAKLIPRFYELGQGSISIDGRDVSSYPLNVLRKNISLVLQDSLLFEGTIRENIAIGQPDATLEQIMDAAQKANIHGMIMRLPEGYETLVREQGSNFSGGQRQRLAIARAILRDTPILILDEPTANLDVESEAEVMNALSTLIHGRTVLTISHRLSTLGKVDELVVMSAGRIVEQGSFKALKRARGIFAHLLEEQNRYHIERDDDEDATLVVRSVHPQARTALARITGALSTASARRTALAWPDDVDEDALTSEHVVVIPSVTQRFISDLPTLSLPIVPETPVPQALQKQEERHPERASVQIEIDGKHLEVIPLHGPTMMIGRRSSSDIHISSPRISRYHAILLWKNDSWVIEDLDSFNGLTWQGERIRERVLAPDDRIYLDANIICHYQEKI
jgi:ATP-binding cassette, subfamily B, bacterial